MKINRKIIIIGVLAAIVAVGAWGVAADINTRLTQAKDAAARNTAILDDILVSNTQLIKTATDSQCNRSNIVSKNYCEEVEVRIYSSPDIDQYKREAVSVLTSNGWESDIQGAQIGFTQNASENASVIAQTSARRNANNDTTGASIPQNLLISLEKNVPSNSGGYFKNTRIKYSEELNAKLTDAVSKGESLIIVTAYHKYESWF